LRQGRFIVLESFELEKAKTRDLVAKLKVFNIDQKTLIVLDEVNENIYLAARNLHKIELTDVETINPVNLIHYEKVLITASALKKIEELLA